jgi:DNA-binding transcriptional ArsR family regulator
MPLTHRRVTDASALKALAHPLRMALLEALVTEGPMTASEAAGLLEESPSNCSWHLRKLAEHGFVREARGATGRQRPWQAVSEGLEWGTDDPDGTPDPSTRLAAEGLTDMLVERELQRLRAARASRDREPAAWREATGLIHSQLWLTAEEARAVKERLHELLLTHAERSGAPGDRPADARLVSLVGWLVPSGPRRGQEPS